MSFKEQAEQLVRDRLPELKELSLGCEIKLRFIDGDWVKGIVVESAFLNQYAVAYFDGIPPRYIQNDKDLKIIGHPILLNHWLRVLEKINVEYVQVQKCIRVVPKGIGHYVDFNLTTGQPNSEEDYRKIVELIK